MPTKPRKPWRVTLAGPDAKATYSFTSEAKTYAFIRSSLSGDSPAVSARVEQWEGGRWRHFETVDEYENPFAADGCLLHPGGCVAEDHFPAEQIIDQYRLMTWED